MQLIHTLAFGLASLAVSVAAQASLSNYTYYTLHAFKHKDNSLTLPGELLALSYPFGKDALTGIVALNNSAERDYILMEVDKRDNPGNVTHVYQPGGKDLVMGPITFLGYGDLRAGAANEVPTHSYKYYIDEDKYLQSTYDNFLGWFGAGLYYATKNFRLENLTNKKCGFVDIYAWHVYG